MSPLNFLASILFRKSSFLMHKLILVIVILMPLAGCSNDGAGGPVISSLSTPTDATAESDSPTAFDSEGADSEGVSFDGEADPALTMASTPSGITAHLTWDAPSDFEAAGYYIYYGKHTPEEPGSEESASEEPSTGAPSSCSQGESQAVSATAATITGLEPNTPYFFAIRAVNKNESESLCSNEITAVTPSAQF
jgi:hypothetical protein